MLSSLWNQTFDVKLGHNLRSQNRNFASTDQLFKSDRNFWISTSVISKLCQFLRILFLLSDVLRRIPTPTPTIKKFGAASSVRCSNSLRSGLALTCFLHLYLSLSFSLACTQTHVAHTHARTHAQTHTHTHAHKHTHLRATLQLLRHHFL